MFFIISVRYEFAQMCLQIFECLLKFIFSAFVSHAHTKILPLGILRWIFGIILPKIIFQAILLKCLVVFPYNNFAMLFYSILILNSENRILEHLLKKTLSMLLYTLNVPRSKLCSISYWAMNVVKTFQMEVI